VASRHIPAVAIEAFESLTGLQIAIHDLHGYLHPLVRPETFFHTNPFCEAVKDSGYDPVCSDTDWLALHNDIRAEPEGRIKVCPAGLVECVVPLFFDNRLSAVLFAGVRRVGPDLVERCRTPMLSAESIQWPAGVPLPPPVGENEAQHALESLRQLSARLRLWWHEFGRTLAAPAETSYGTPTDEVARAVQIRNFIRQYHTQRITLQDLAEDLSLSPGRTGHVVREVCGRSFGDLLKRTRLSTAIALLRQSALPVMEVAILSGFGDVSHFTRTFKAATGTTPHRYRKVYQHGHGLLLSDEAARAYGEPPGLGFQTPLD